MGNGVDSLFVVPDGADGNGGVNNDDVSEMGWVPLGVGSPGENREDGRGGGGGGGAGGVSHGALCSNSTLTISNSFFTKGISGAEGGPNGAKGLSLNQQGCE